MSRKVKSKSPKVVVNPQKKKGLTTSVHIRFSGQDIEYIRHLEETKGWDRSKAIRYMVRAVGKTLETGEITDMKFFDKDPKTKIIKVPHGTKRVLIELEE